MSTLERRWPGAKLLRTFSHAPDIVYDEVRVHFSDIETVHLTLVITTINAWNRIAISLGSHSHRG